ncbi:MAG: primosomal protein N' [Alphaproteobacteria bacterium]
MPLAHASSEDTHPAPDRDGGRISVLLPVPVGAAFDYHAVPGLDLAPGDYVRVPLGGREVIGMVWDAPKAECVVAAKPIRLRDVIERFDLRPLGAIHRRFIEWVASYTMTPLGAVLRMTLNSPQALAPPKSVTAFAPVAGWLPPQGFRMTPARTRVLGMLAGGPPLAMAELTREATTGAGVVHGLKNAGALMTIDMAPPAPFAAPDWRRKGVRLSPRQAKAARALCQRVAEPVADQGGDGDGEHAAGFSVTLLEGVTGSGKTEVYLEAVAAAVAQGRQVLVLLPEIALTAQWLERFRARFGVAPAQWHSDLGSRQRRLSWRAVADGKAQVVVGARSALYLPFRDLGLIIIDEEHDGSFKQEDGVLYNARDMAVVRARLGEIPAILVSATPSLESVTNVRDGRYRHLHLPDRHGGAELPAIHLVDMRTDLPPAGCWLSPTLRGALEHTLGARQQAMLFLNRRGYAPLTLCRGCGHRLKCPNCTAWLVEHRFQDRLACHHCDYTLSLPESCPHCSATEAWAACGPGVERLAEEVTALFPEIRLEIMASDTLAGPDAAARLVGRVERHEIDVLIGTQIMAKGHHFPLLTLVGVVDADLGLAGGDLRATERTYQLLAQVAGRAGRGREPGEVFLQTYDPGHQVMQALASGDREAFLGAEVKARQDAGMPPFGRLAAVILSSAHEDEVDRWARALARAAPRVSGLAVLGPAPAPLSFLRGRHRRRFLVKGGRQMRLQPTLKSWLGAIKLPRSVRLQVDIDPYSFL